MFGIASFAQTPFASLAGVSSTLVISEGISLADSSTQLSAFLLSQIEPIDVAAINSDAGLYFGSVVETVRLADASATITNFKLPVVENLSSNDVRVITAQFAASIAENSVPTEVATTYFAFLQSLTEPIGVNDVRVGQGGFVVSSSENSSIQDTSSITAQFQQSVAEAIVANDISTIAAQFAQSVAEGATVQDVSVAIKIFTDFVIENFGTASVETIVAGFFDSVVENLNANDICTVLAGFVAAITENSVLADDFGVGGWVTVVDTQAPSWVLISDVIVTGAWWATVASPSSVLMLTSSIVNPNINYFRVSTSTSAFGGFTPPTAYSNSAYVNGYFYVFDYFVMRPLLRSVDGITWETVNVPVPGSGVRCVFGNGTQLGIIQDTAVYISTDNGATWTGGSISFIPDGYGQAIWDGTKYVLVIGGQRRASLNGITWITVGNLAGYTHGFVAWNGTHYVTLRTSANASNISVSTNGTTYTTVPATTESSTAAVLELIDNQFIFINESGEVLRLDAATSTFTKLGQVPNTTYSRAAIAIYTFKKFQGKVYLSGSRLAPNTYLTTTDFGSYTVNQAPGWAGVDDSQNPNWQNINNWQ